MTRYTLFLLTVILLSACTRSNPGNGPTPGVPTGDSSGNPAGDPLVFSYSMNSGNVGDTIWIVGKNFSKIATNNQITFSAASAVAIESKVAQGTTNDSLKVLVPPGASTSRLTVSVLSKTVTGKDTFWITTGTWIRRADFPNGGRVNGLAFGIGSKGYFGFGVPFGYIDQQDFWEFDPALSKWTRKADCPSCEASTGFAIGNTIYVGFDNSAHATAVNTFHTYDPSTDSWSIKGSVPVEGILDAVSFAAAGKGYVTNKNFTYQFLVYDPASGIWTVNNNFPVPQRNSASGFVINDELYLGGGHWDTVTYTDLWKYSPSSDKWTQLANAFSGSYPLTSFALNGKGYWLLGNGAYKGSGFYEYDPATARWSMKKAFPGLAYKNEMSFVANNQAFVTGGAIFISIGHDSLSPETWQFVP